MDEAVVSVTQTEGLTCINERKFNVVPDRPSTVHWSCSLELLR